MTNNKYTNRPIHQLQELLRLNGVDEEWEPILLPALMTLEDSYLEWMAAGEGYIPPRDRLLAAFSTLRPNEVRYILFGQDPYPRPESAIGYAFIDGRVREIFSPRGLSREVNRATSLRNFIKMALVARGSLDPRDTSQEAIAALDKTLLVSQMRELRENFERSGVLLLNMALLFTSKEESRRHIRAWRAFIEKLLEGFEAYGPTLILFGAHAREVQKLKSARGLPQVALEHPYNHTFIVNEKAWELFGPMDLLLKR
ncbi:uracil-DNA glycosylase [Nitratifractor salsuginis DSM 16511]|uniref:Uracil-DNA glycosylase n=2 Tax=Nitratifractor salsuginis (strain DSM 16511 / JCM 12458 / E9I37-1) TaxID=749222 RepID=E6WYZ8_NITSE|nr:uracil-DNA glycosylase [Nitratifractor salsuginis DSM 16511]